MEDQKNNQRVQEELRSGEYKVPTRRSGSKSQAQDKSSTGYMKCHSCEKVYKHVGGGVATSDSD